MKKYFTTILLILFSTITYACDCSPSDIQTSYLNTNPIFYGKYLYTDTVKGFNNIFGEPVIVDNFEVEKFYKGIDSSTFHWLKDQRGDYVISLINSCHGPCGICFEKNNMYLIYPRREPYSGYLITNGCTRTRKIENKNFVVSTSFDPDYGKDENKELNKLMLSDTNRNSITGYNNSLESKKEPIKSQFNDTSDELQLKTTLLYLVSIVALIMIFYLSYKLRKLKNNT